MGQPDLNDAKAEELTAIIREIRERVRQRYPDGQARGLSVALPDLLPILHARDAAEAKVASIGSVNPRAGGPVNAVIQWAKRLVARSLNWFVRDQIEFNRSVLAAVEATLESLNEVNRTFSAVGSRLDELAAAGDSLRGEAAELKDIRVHWIRWREDWEKKVLANEVHYLRSLADLQGLNEQRLGQLDASYRESLKRQHVEFAEALRRFEEASERRHWSELERLRLEYERLIHNELRVVRQKLTVTSAAASPSTATGSPVVSAHAAPHFDYARFADRFRGSEEYVRNNQRVYLPYLEGRRSVLDIGCGRGEFLDLMREAGIGARGIDLDPESVALCQSKGHQAEVADLFEWLPEQPGGAFDGIVSAQVIEHLPPERLPGMIGLCAEKLAPGGVLVLETPNPECLAIFATHFYLDPTHTRPIPPSLLVFYFEEAGLGGIEVRRLAPAVESMPSLAELPPAFRETFFGGLDYGIIGRKL